MNISKRPPMPGYVWRPAKGPGLFAYFSGLVGGDAEDNPHDDHHHIGPGYNLYETGFGTNRWLAREGHKPKRYALSEFSSKVHKSWRDMEAGQSIEEIVEELRHHGHNTRGLKEKLEHVSKRALRHRVISVRNATLKAMKPVPV